MTHLQLKTPETFFDEVYGVVSKSFPNVSTEMILRLGVELAAAVNQFEHLSGTQKMEYVQKLLLTVLDKIEKERGTSFSEKEKEALHLLRECLQTVLPQVLALTVDVAKGRIVFQKVLHTWLNCLPFCAKWTGSSPSTMKITPVKTETMIQELSEKVFEPRETSPSDVQIEVAVPVPTKEESPSTTPLQELPPLPPSRPETPEPAL